MVYNDFNTGLVNVGVADDSVTTGTGITAHVMIQGGQCVLTPAITSNSGNFVVRNPAGINTNNLQLDWLSTTSPLGYGSSILGGGGWAWSYAPDIKTGGTLSPSSGGFNAENGSGSGIKIAVDGTPNGAVNITGVYLMYNCQTLDQGPSSAGVLAFVPGTFWQGLVNAPLSIVITEDGYITLKINNLVVFDHIALPAAYLAADKSTWIHGFTSRTGAADMFNALDNLNIRYNTYEYSINSTNGTDGTWQSTNVFTGLASGTYPIWVRNPSNPSCFTNTGTVAVGVSASPSSALTVAAPGYGTTICAGSTTNLTTDVSIPGATFLWESSSTLGGPWSAASGINNTGVYTTDALITNMYYRCTFTCPSSSPITSTPALVLVNIGSITSTNSPQYVSCSGGSVTLTATPGANTNCVWYAASSGGTPLYSGNSYSFIPSTIPSTYYVEPVSALFTNHFDNGGQKVISNGLGTTSNSTSISTRFNASSSIRIDSIKVFPTSTGTLTVALQNALSTTNLAIFTLAIPTTGSFINVPVNFIVPGSGAYQITTSGVNCTYYSSYTAGYAAAYMSLGGVFSLVGGATTPTGTSSTSIYGTAFNWSITTSCPSGFGSRVPVLVQTDPATAVNITPASVTLCNGIAQMLVASSTAVYDSINWTPITNLFLDSLGTVPYTAGFNTDTIWYKSTTSSVVTFTCHATNLSTGCNNIATSVVTVQPATAIIIATPSIICGTSGSSVMTLSPASSYGLNGIQWQNSSDGITYSPISGAITNSYSSGTISAINYYKVIIKDSYSNTCFSTLQTIHIANPFVNSTTDSVRCGIGSVTIGATGNSGTVLKWYNAATGGVSIGSGSLFTTPIISNTTTFYVSASSLDSIETAGKLAPTSTENIVGNQPLGLSFNITSKTAIIKTVKIYSVGVDPGNLYVQLWNSAGTVLNTAGPFTYGPGSVVSPTEVTLPLDFVVPVGTGYRLLTTQMSGGSLIRESGVNNVFPYVSASGNISVTSGYIASSGTSTTYYYLYNWQVQSLECESARSAVIANVTPSTPITPTATSTTVCSGSGTTLNVTSTNDPNYNYTWTPGNATTTSVNVNPISTTTYTVTATDPTTGCADVKSINIVVNPLPATLTVTPPITSICGSGTGSQVLTASGGTPAVVTIGTGTVANGTTTYPSPYGQYFGSSHEQYLILASELTAQGLTAGLISNVAFNVTTAYTGTALSNFNINMKNITATNMSAFVNSGFTNVYTATGTVSPTVGLNTYTFGTPFTWDGTSNVIVDVGFSNCSVCTVSGCTTAYTTNAIVQQSNTSFVSTYNVHADGNCTINTFSPSITGTSYSQRPNMKFSGFTPPTFTWSPSTGLSSTTGSSVTASPSSPVTYTVTATNGFGCTATSSAIVNVSANPKPVIVGGGVNVCFPDEVTLSVVDTSAAYLGATSAGSGYPAGTTIDWLSMVNNQNTISSSNGTYFRARVNLPTGCFGISDTSIVNTKTVAVSSSVTPASCGNNNGAMKATVGGGFGLAPVAPYHYVWTNSSNVVIRDTVSNMMSDSMSNISAGSYSVIVYDNYGGGSGFSCNSGQVSIIVTNTGSLTATVTSTTNVTCPGSLNGAATLTIVGGVSPLTINWSNGASTTTLSGLSGGTYIATVTDGLGCQDTALALIHEPLPFSYDVSYSNTNCYGGSDGGATVVITGGTAPYDYSFYDEFLTTELANNSALSGVPAGNYNVYLNGDGHGCLDVANPNGYAFVIGQPNQTTITSFTPGSASVGSVVAIAGSGFTGATAVSFNGHSASFIVDNDGQITAIVPSGATTGTVSVIIGSCGSITCTAVFTVNANVTLNLHAYIEGYYIGSGQMQSVLLNQGVSTNPTEMDTLHIELRDQFSTSTVIVAANAVMDVSGNASFSLPGSVSGGSYYVAVFHRNAVQTWSALPITFSGTTTYDFASGTSQVYGDNEKDLGDGNFAMFTGDLNQDEFVDAFDFPQFDFDALSGVGGVYAPTDMNGDGYVDAFDFPVYDFNSLSGASSIHP